MDIPDTYLWKLETNFKALPHGFNKEIHYSTMYWVVMKGSDYVGLPEN